MLALMAAARDPAVVAFINDIYHRDEVQGIALGVHGQFRDFVVAAHGREKSVNDVLNDGKFPAAWDEECLLTGALPSTSPIFIAVYVSVNPETFRKLVAIPEAIAALGGRQYLVYVEYRAPFEAVADRTNHRPVIPGTSVSGDVGKEAGTVAALLRDMGCQDEYLLSCYHVLCGGGSTTALQRAHGDGGSSADVVGQISHSITLTTATRFSFSSPFHRADAGLALLSAARRPTIRLLGVKPHQTCPVSAIELGDPVVFVGKESDRNEAYVYRFVARAKWRWKGGIYNFGDIFEIEPRRYRYFGSLARPGDSGSLVVRLEEEDPERCVAYGVLFGSSGRFALCCFAEYVVADLEAKSGLKLDYS